MSDWIDVTEKSGLPGRPATLRKDRGDGFYAEVWRVANVIGWSVWGPTYQTALRSGESDTVEGAMTAAENALRVASS
jgi:hypothetical protein